MKLLLVAALIFAYGCAIKDRNYIQLLEEDNYTKDVIIKDLERRVK